MDPEQPTSAATDPPPQRPIALEYHLPTERPPIDVTPYLGEPLGLALVVVGVALLPLPHRSCPPAGLALLSLGGGWWAFSRAKSKGGAGRAWGALCLVGAITCTVGLLAVAQRANAGGSTRGIVYWFTENQTYRYTRSYALKPLVISAVGACWLLALGFAYVVRRLAGLGAVRNNRPLEQE